MDVLSHPGWRRTLGLKNSTRLPSVFRRCFTSYPRGFITSKWTGGNGKTKGSPAEFLKRSPQSCRQLCREEPNELELWCHSAALPLFLNWLVKLSFSLTCLYLWVIIECFVMMQAIPNDVTACICGVMVNKPCQDKWSLIYYKFSAN